MAVQERDLDGDEAHASKTPKAPGHMKLVIVGAFALFLALVGAQVTGPILTQMLSGHGNAESGAEHGDEEALAMAEEGVIEIAKLEPAVYTPLDPPFVVSFTDDHGGSRYLQLTLQAMARNEKAISGIKQHAPAIRNEFLFLLSKYEVAELATLEGKERLRADMLAAAQNIMAENTGDPSIEELYFTSLVIQ